MKKSAYLKGRLGGICMNFSELFPYAILYRRPPQGAELERRVEYGDGPREWLNLITARDDDKKRPLLIYIHGGGWCSGLVGMRNSYCYEYVKRGFNAVNVGYEYAPMRTFPFQLKQLFKAIDWIFDHAAEYGIDTERIVLAGESAGPHFVFHIAGMMLRPELFTKLDIDFRHFNDFKISAIVSICGAADVSRLVDSKFPGIKYMLNAYTGLSPSEIRAGAGTEEIRIMSPYIGAGFPPTMLVYGEHDYLKRETFALKERFDEIGTPYGIYRGTGILSLHAFQIATCVRKGQECLEETLDFISPYLK